MIREDIINRVEIEKCKEKATRFFLDPIGESARYGCVEYRMLLERFCDLALNEKGMKLCKDIWIQRKKELCTIYVLSSLTKDMEHPCHSFLEIAAIFIDTAILYEKEKIAEKKIRDAEENLSA